MKVLGLSPLDKDSTVTLMVDGEIVHRRGDAFVPAFRWCRPGT